MESTYPIVLEPIDSPIITEPSETPTSMEWYISEKSLLDPRKYTVFRLDGRAFSSLVKRLKLNKPFDDRFTHSMKHTAKELFKEFNFKIGFVGSDEITMCLFPKFRKEGTVHQSDMAFGGRKDKLLSLMAGFTSVTFYKKMAEYGFVDIAPVFDCRVFQFDSLNDVLYNINERIVFTLKNARMMFCQNIFSHKKLHNLASEQAVKLVLDETGEDFYKKIESDNRVGNVIMNIQIHKTKTIIIKGVEQTIEYERNEPLFTNIAPSDIFKLEF